MAASALVHRAPDVVFQRLAGEEGAVLLHLDTGVYHGLNPVGARIWEYLDSPRTEPELAELVSGDFEESEDSLFADVRAFLHSLEERGLVQRNGSS
jgi:hypothetical protein